MSMFDIPEETWKELEQRMEEMDLRMAATEKKRDDEAKLEVMEFIRGCSGKNFDKPATLADWDDESNKEQEVLDMLRLPFMGDHTDFEDYVPQADWGATLADWDDGSNKEPPALDVIRVPFMRDHTDYEDYVPAEKKARKN